MPKHTPAEAPETASIPETLRCRTRDRVFDLVGGTVEAGGDFGEFLGLLMTKTARGAFDIFSGAVRVLRGKPFRKAA